MLMGVTAVVATDGVVSVGAAVGTDGVSAGAIRLPVSSSLREERTGHDSHGRCGAPESERDGPPWATTERPLGRGWRRCLATQLRLKHRPDRRTGPDTWLEACPSDCGRDFMVVGHHHDPFPMASRRAARARLSKDSVA